MNARLGGVQVGHPLHTGAVASPTSQAPLQGVCPRAPPWPTVPAGSYGVALGGEGALGPLIPDREALRGAILMTPMLAPGLWRQRLAKEERIS